MVQIPTISNSDVDSYTVNERIAIASPPSIVLGAIQRYFDIQGNVVHLIVPLMQANAFGTIALEKKVLVAHEAHPNRALIGRYDDRVVIRWTPLEGAGPAFEGRFTIRPKGTGTELGLKGRCVPPTESLSLYVPGAVFDEHVAKAMILFLLEQLSAVVEAEFQACKAFSAPKRPIESRHKARHLATCV